MDREGKIAGEIRVVRGWPGIGHQVHKASHFVRFTYLNINTYRRLGTLSLALNLGSPGNPWKTPVTL